MWPKTIFKSFLKLERSIIGNHFHYYSHTWRKTIFKHFIFPLIRTEHQWKPSGDPVKTGGPNWHRQQIQPKTLPPQVTISRSVQPFLLLLTAPHVCTQLAKGGTSVDWSRGMYQGYFPMPSQSYPMMVQQPYMVCKPSPVCYLLWLRGLFQARIFSPPLRCNNSHPCSLSIGSSSSNPRWLPILSNKTPLAPLDLR